MKITIGCPTRRRTTSPFTDDGTGPGRAGRRARHWPLGEVGGAARGPQGYAVVVSAELADPTRRTILDELAEKSGQTLFEICSRLSMKHQLGISRQAVSQHLAVLEAAGLVETRREGRYKFHDLNTAPLRQIAERWPVPDPSRPEKSAP
jgi:DNA-binding transcriptional ArsR family regulator